MCDKIRIFIDFTDYLNVRLCEKDSRLGRDSGMIGFKQVQMARRDLLTCAVLLSLLVGQYCVIVIDIQLYIRVIFDLP